MHKLFSLSLAVITTALAGCELCDQQPELCSSGAFVADDEENPGEAAVLPQDDRNTFQLNFEWTPDVIRRAEAGDVNFLEIGNLVYQEDLESITIMAQCIDNTDGREHRQVPGMERVVWTRFEAENLVPGEPIEMTLDLTFEQREHLSYCQLEIYGRCTSDPDCIQSIVTYHAAEPYDTTFTYGTFNVSWSDEEDGDVLELDPHRGYATYLYESPYAADLSWRVMTLDWDGTEVYTMGADENGQAVRRPVQVEIPEWITEFYFETTCRNIVGDAVFSTESLRFTPQTTQFSFAVSYSQRRVRNCVTELLGTDGVRDRSWTTPEEIVFGHLTYQMDELDKTFDAIHADQFGRSLGNTWYEDLDAHLYYRAGNDPVPHTLPPLAE